MVCSVAAPLSLPAPDLPQRLDGIIVGLQKAVAARAGRHPLLAPLVLLVWPYLRRLMDRFERLATRVRAGGRSKPRPGTAGTQRTPSPGPRLPQGAGWLTWLAPEARSYGSQLRHLLADPDMVAFLDADPRVGRILRPLCHALGIRRSPDVPASLFPPKVAREHPAPKPPAASVRRSAPEPATASQPMQTAPAVPTMAEEPAKEPPKEPPRVPPRTASQTPK